jgi:amidase
MSAISDQIAYHRLSARELSAGLTAGRWSSEELTCYFLNRIQAINPSLHAIHSLNDKARDEAKAIDARRAAGETLGPLAGLPMSLKDAFAVKGLRSTYGTQLFSRNRPRQDCKIVSTLREAGLVLLGRSAIPTASFDWNCRNQVFAECLNPHDSARTPGGSSGGAAAALAAGLTPLELGSDVAGSIRYPAHCCGVYGLRSTDGWLPMSDIGPDPKRGFSHLAVCGPMANHLDDLTLLLELFGKAFPDPRLKPFTPTGPSRIAYSWGVQGLDPEPETRALMQRWLEGLNQAGAKISEDLPALDFASLDNDWCLLVGYELVSNLPPALPRALGRRLLDAMVLKRLGPGWMRPGLLDGMRIKQPEYLATLARYQAAQDAADQFFSRYDAWVLPTSPSPALRLSECGTLLKTHLGSVPYTEYIGRPLCSTAMLGTPALALPIGKTLSGLPVGLQIHGPRFGDAALLARMQQLIRAAGL